MKTLRPLLPLIAAAALFAGRPLAADSLVTTDAFLPVVHITGATGIYVSDVNIFNPNQTNVDVTFYFTPADTDGSNLNGVRLNPPLGARESYTIQDALRAIFNVSSGYGVLEVYASQPIIVTSNTINIAANCTGGTFGQFSPGQPGEPGRAAIGFGTTNDYDLYVAGIPYDQYHRTNAVVMNTTNATLHATMELRDANGISYGNTTANVPPYSLHQFNDVFGMFAPNQPFFDPSWRLNFYVNTNNGAKLLAYVTITDTRSGDPYLVPASAQLVDVPARPAPDGAVRLADPVGSRAGQGTAAPRTPQFEPAGPRR